MTLCAWVQYVGTSPTFTEDVVTANVDQHASVWPGEVVFLPFETCQRLVTVEPQRWQPLTVVPDVLSGQITHDNPTGLDYIDAPVAHPFGIAGGTSPYFDLAGRIGVNESARCIVQGNQVSFQQ